MNIIDTINYNLTRLFIEKKIKRLDLRNDEGMGIVLDSCYSSEYSKNQENIELKEILYDEKNAELLGVGIVDIPFILRDVIYDEDDWYTIEDVVNDLI